MSVEDADDLRRWMAALRLAVQERDEARAGLTKAQKLADERVEWAMTERAQAIRELSEARAEVEQLRALLLAFGSEEAMASELRNVAKRQREACAEAMHCGVPGCKCSGGDQKQVLETPLVTEDGK